MARRRLHNVVPWGETEAGRLVPFIALAVIALASSALPPGPSDRKYLLASVGMMILVGLTLLLPWQKMRDGWQLIPALGYIASIALLMLAMGGESRGLEAMILAPILWAALYSGRKESAVIIVCAAFALADVSLIGATGHDLGWIVARRVFFWVVLGTFVSIAVHNLRSHLIGSEDSTGEQTRRMLILQEASKELSAILAPAVVAEASVRFISDLVSQPRRADFEAKFLRIVGNRIHSGADFDLASGFHYELDDDPYVSRAVETCESFRSSVDREALGKTARAIVDARGTTHGAWIPIAPDRSIVGVIAISGKQQVPVDLFELCATIGWMTELAMVSALNRDEMPTKATTDAETGLANRLGFELFLDHRPQGDSFVLIAARVGTTPGSGREELVAASGALRSALRRGDLLARLDGNEFAAFLAHAGEAHGAAVADRLMEALSRLAVDGEGPRVTIGIACGAPDSAFDQVHTGAARAMNRAELAGRSSRAVGEDGEVVAFRLAELESGASVAPGPYRPFNPAKEGQAPRAAALSVAPVEVSPAAPEEPEAERPVVVAADAERPEAEAAEVAEPVAGAAEAPVPLGTALELAPPAVAEAVEVAEVADVAGDPEAIEEPAAPAIATEPQAAAEQAPPDAAATDDNWSATKVPTRRRRTRAGGRSASSEVMAEAGQRLPIDEPALD
ncbi:MAG TPA: GGDEF domain-containing protein [Acidimicrobiales bacterium]|nr:GGDEF domain-containing protein [Acidimicrobiales bacterium]